MAKMVDLNERVLEQEQKNFLRFCKISHILLIIARVVVIMAVVFGFVAVVTSFKEDSENGQDMFMAVYALVLCIGMVVSINYGIGVFKKLRCGETPITFDIADKIKAVGITLIATAGVSFAISAVKSTLVLFCVLSGEVKIEVELGFLLAGFMACALAYIFNYGCKLQQESDETI